MHCDFLCGCVLLAATSKVSQHDTKPLAIDVSATRGASSCQQQPTPLMSPCVPSCQHDRGRRGVAECKHR